MMRAIKIDPFARTVEEIETVGDLASMKDVLQDGPCLVRISRQDILWVGDNGMLTAGIPVFRWKAYDGPLAGMGLILGIDEEGDNVDATVTLEKAKEQVVWTDAETTGSLMPDREYVRDDGAVVYEIGQPILRGRGW